MKIKRNLNASNDLDNKKLYELKLLCTHNTGINRWSWGLAVMPQSGDVVVSGREDLDDPWFLFVFTMKDGQLKEKKRISSSCGHRLSTCLSSLIIEGQEQLIVSCQDCNDIKLVDPQGGEWSTAFTGCKPSALCSKGSHSILIQSRSRLPILQLDCSSSVFKRTNNTLHTNIACMAMCYIPPPVDALVLSDDYSSKMVAFSVERGVVIWEFQEKKGGINQHPNKLVLDCMDLLFHPKHNVLLVADGFRERVLIVNPGTGGLIQTIDVPDMGAINALGLQNDQIVLLHGKDTWKISYLNLL